MNFVILKGNLTRSPELSFTPNQVQVCDFGLAVNKKWKGQDGQQHEEVLFVDCRAFKRTAEAIGQYFDKGSPILIQGELHYSSWEKNGQKHSKIRVTVRSFEFMDSKRDQQPQQAPQQQAPQQPAYGSPEDDGSIPF
jgi:single-strand DNA-binding protein